MKIKDYTDIIRKRYEALQASGISSFPEWNAGDKLLWNRGDGEYATVTALEVHESFTVVQLGDGEGGSVSNGLLEPLNIHPSCRDFAAAQRRALIKRVK